MVTKKLVEQLWRKIKGIDVGVNHAFSKVRQELDEHLDAINQNTSELSVTNQYVAHLESKIEKLNERLDELTVGKTVEEDLSAYEDVSITLSIREQEVFLLLYIANEKKSISYLSRYLGLTAEFIQQYISRLVSKGVPIRTYESADGERVYSLERGFKDLQARKNIIALDQRVLEEYNVTSN